MKALRLHAVNDLRLDEVDKPEISGKEILVRVKACGICGSDIPRTFRLGTKVNPVTLGHEFSGIVEKVAASEDQDLIGKRVSVFNIAPCHQCEACSKGDYAHCEHISYLGTRLDGGFAGYCRVPSRFNLVVCDHETVSDQALAMMEPMSVALHVIRKAEPLPWNSMLIIGAGPIGILAARWAKVFGVKKILLIDVVPEKIDFAKEHGVDAVSAENADMAVKKMFGAADITIEGTGSSAGLAQAVKLTTHGGKIILLGNPAASVSLEVQQYSELLRKELTIKSTWNSYYGNDPVNEWRFGMEALADGRMEVDDLVTHTADLGHIKELFEKINDKRVLACKAMLVNEERC